MLCILHKEVSESHSVVSDSLQPHGLHNPWNSPGQNTGVGSHSLLQGRGSKGIKKKKKSIILEGVMIAILLQISSD